MAMTKKAAGRKAATRRATKKATGVKTATRRVAKKSSRGNTAAKKSATGLYNKPGMTDESMLMELFTDMLKDIYWAEKHLLKVLPKMAKAATAPQLKEALMNHLNQTEGHVARVEDVFSILGKKAQAKKCEAMEGLAKEGEEVIKETAKGSSTRDAGIIVAAQKVEHYEMAAYGSLANIAVTLGHKDAARILHATLEEEKNADAHLSYLAENNVNYRGSTEQEKD